MRNDNNGPVLIDFERCKHSSAPQNVLQVCQFLNSKSLARALFANGKALVLDCSAIREYCRTYKKNNYQEHDFKRILAIVEGAGPAPARPRSPHRSPRSQLGPTVRLGQEPDVLLGSARGSLEPWSRACWAGETCARGRRHDAAGRTLVHAGADANEDDEDDMEALLRAKGLWRAQGTAVQAVVAAGDVEEEGAGGEGGGVCAGADTASLAVCASGPYEETLVEAFHGDDNGRGHAGEEKECTGSAGPDAGTHGVTWDDETHRWKQGDAASRHPFHSELCLLVVGCRARGEVKSRLGACARVRARSCVDATTPLYGAACRRRRSCGAERRSVG